MCTSTRGEQPVRSKNRNQQNVVLGPQELTEAAGAASCVNLAFFSLGEGKVHEVWDTLYLVHCYNVSN